MSSFCLRFSWYMDERKAWREAFAVYRHAITLVWISISVVKRLPKWMKSRNVKDGNVTNLWNNNKAIAHFIALF